MIKLADKYRILASKVDQSFKKRIMTLRRLWTLIRRDAALLTIILQDACVLALPVLKRESRVTGLALFEF